jgi:tetratricopeptide (TPR) repeat protein
VGRRKKRKLQGVTTAPEPGSEVPAEAQPEGPDAGDEAVEAQSPDTGLGRARLFRERGQLVEAVEELEALRSESPDDVEVLWELGATLTAAGRPVEGERVLRRALRLDPDRFDIHHHLGVLLFKRGLYRPAVAALRRAIELDDGNGEAFFYLGEGLNQLGEVDAALAALERAVQFQPANARAYFTMGLLYDRKHLRQEATTMYRKARELGAA